MCGNRTEYVDVKQGATLLDAICLAELSFSAPCGGKGTCNKCAVLLTDSLGTREVLACKTKVSQDANIEIPDTVISIDGASLHPTSNTQRHGVALDLGTTTLAAELVNLDTDTVVACAGCLNPQLVYGADVVSRIEAASTGQLASMHRTVSQKLQNLIHELCALSGVALSRIERVVLVGNTVMEHIAAGISPQSIGVAPYEPQTLFGDYLTLSDELPPVWFAPCVSGYVGGDVVAGMLMQELSPSLLVDLGTNGELALCTQQTSYAAATAAGPVFEGMNIRYGMPALPGALRVARYNEHTDEFTVDIIGGGTAEGICGSGLIDIAALLLTHGLVDETGRLLLATECDSPLASRLITHEGMPAFKPLPDAPLVVTQEDIRNLQLAKSALATGIEVLLDTAGLELASVANLTITGSFGQHINKEHAANLGLIPAALLPKTSSFDNSALLGARKVLVDESQKLHMLELARTTQVMELNADSRFSDWFIDNLQFTCPEIPQKDFDSSSSKSALAEAASD